MLARATRAAELLDVRSAVMYPVSTRGVHCMCGFHAAARATRDRLGELT
jgi:hypothetical protein